MVLLLLSSLVFLRRSTLLGALGLMFATGFALSVDTRNALYLPIAFACVLIANRGRNYWKVLALCGGLAALSMPNVLQRYFQSDYRHELSWSDKQAFQHLSSTSE